jgi:ring-1,2-phenylacetyl-CoA epoxidase subunit PaaE
MVNYTLKVFDRREETKDTTTIIFKQPSLKKIKYLAGQYITLIFRINGRKYSRPYSFSSAPNVDGYLEVTVKRTPGGVISNHICDKVQVGDVIEAMAPMGDFIVPESVLQSNDPVILWGAGSGITPLFSIAKYLLAQDANRKITLVYGNRTFESVIFKNQLEKLQSDFSEKFSVLHVHTQLVVEESQPYLIQGRIDRDRAVAIMKDVSANSFHYICGPVGLKESVKSALNYLTINPDNIFSEDFELVKNEKDFEDVITRSVKIIKDGRVVTLEVTKGKSILEAGLDAMLDINYSCQTGNCSMCKGKIVTGYVKQLVKKHVDLLEDEYQLCCTYPLTDDVEVSI